MSYRTYVNGTQLFGNNQGYPEWLAFIEKQGIEIDAEGKYDGEITDIMGALCTIEAITMRLAKERRSRQEKWKKSNVTIKDMFDWSNIYEETLADEENKENSMCSLFDRLKEAVENGYAFLPYAFILACEDKIEMDNLYSTDGHMNCYKIKDGEHIKVKAK